MRRHPIDRLAGNKVVERDVRSRRQVSPHPGIGRLSRRGRLVALVGKLEDGDISLEDSVKSFEEGIGLVKECQKQLSEAELKVKKLLDNGETVDLED